MKNEHREKERDLLNQINTHAKEISNKDQEIEELNKKLVGKEELKGTKKLVALLRMANHFTSDAIANLLMTEAILRDKDFCMPNFCGLYKECPS